MRYLFSLALVAFGLSGLSVISAQAASPTGKDFYGGVYLGAIVGTQETSWARGDAPRGRTPGAGQVAPDIRSRNVELRPIRALMLAALSGFGSMICSAWKSPAAIAAIRPIFKPNRGLTADGMDAGTAPDQCGFDNDPANNAMEIACPTVSVDIVVIPVMFNNYFYPLMPFDLLPKAHQIYFGFGVGVGLWSFDGTGFKDDYLLAVMLSGTVGYDLYLSGAGRAWISCRRNWMMSSSASPINIAGAIPSPKPMRQALSFLTSTMRSSNRAATPSNLPRDMNSNLG